MGIVTIMRLCKKHNHSYEAKERIILGHRFYTDCPKCEAERKAQDRAKENAEKLKYEKEIQALQVKINEEAIQDSRIPKRYLKSADLTQPNFKDYIHILENKISGNILIIGNVGTGKTYFVSELMKRNAELNPLYLCGNELSYTQKNDFNLSKLLESIKEHDLIAIDEIGYLLESKFILDLLIDLCYRDDKYLIMAGNIIFRDLKDNLAEHTLSRLRQNIKILEFKGKDLRRENE